MRSIVLRNNASGIGGFVGIAAGFCYVIFSGGDESIVLPHNYYMTLGEYVLSTSVGMILGTIAFDFFATTATRLSAPSDKPLESSLERQILYSQGTDRKSESQESPRDNP